MGFYLKNQNYMGVVGGNRFDNLPLIGSTGSLYVFDSFTFTNGTNTGRFGPSKQNLLDSYNTAQNSWLGNANFFEVENGFQFWTVPKDGIYRFEIRGANGVPALGASSGCEGGQGIILTFDIELIQSEIIKIIVGQSGTAVSNHGGGGGATVVTKEPYNTLESIIGIAGGGGGRRTASSGVGIPGASLITYGGYGTRNGTNSGSSVSGVVANGPTTNSGWNPLASTLGQGGQAANNSYGDGGSGFFGNGFDDNSGGTVVAQLLSGSAVGGGNVAPGGFGGGGDGAGGNGGGGGGGYTGGSGGHTAGGGGCFVSNLATNYSESFNGNVTRIGFDSNLYHGYCKITFI